MLGISKSRLSRPVSELEVLPGVRLLRRSTRKLALTEAGQLFYQHCQVMLAEARAAVDVVQSLRDSPHGTRVSVPVTIAQTFLSAVMPDFMHRFPEVKVVLRVTNRVVVDLFEDAIESPYACAPSRPLTRMWSRGRCGVRSRCCGGRAFAAQAQRSTNGARRTRAIRHPSTRLPPMVATYID